MGKSERIWFWVSIFLSGLILLPLLWYGFGTDQGLYFYGAWVWRRFGEPPYVGTFDHNFPGIFLLCYLIQEVLGEEVIAFRVFDFSWQILTSVLIFRVSFLVLRNVRASFIAVILWDFYYLKLGPWDSGQRDGFLLLPYLISLELVAGVKVGQRNFFRVMLAGLTMGFAVLIKPVALVIVLVLVGKLWVSELRERGWHIWAFVFFMSIPFFMVLAYYLRFGYLAQFYQALFIFSRVYLNSLVMPMVVRLARAVFLETFFRNPLLLLGLIFYLFKVYLKEKDGLSLNVWFKIFVWGIYLSYLIQGKFFSYHQVPVVGILSIFAGGGYLLFFQFLEERFRIRQRVSLVILLVLIFFEPFLFARDLPQFLFKALRYPPAQAQEFYSFHKVCSMVADYVQAKTKPSDKVQVWGGEALINFLSKRRCPTGFPSTLYLEILARSKRYQALKEQWSDRFLRSLKKNPPVYFLIETLPHKGFGIESDQQSLIKNFPEIWEFVNAYYILEIKIGFVECYRLQ